MRAAVIFVNGEFTPSPVLEQVISPDAYIIAVDGGTRHAFRIGVVPHIIIGDLDSLSLGSRVFEKSNRFKTSS